MGDISTAFLHAAVDDDFYVIPPLEFYPDGCTLWKLKKALYGLKRSPKLWQEHFASVMKKNGFRRVKSDPNLYVHETKQLYVLAYVDDLMFFGSKPDVELSVADLQKDLLLKMTIRPQPTLTLRGVRGFFGVCGLLCLAPVVLLSKHFGGLVHPRPMALSVVKVLWQTFRRRE